jgi:hypothetical protein
MGDWGRDARIYAAVGHGRHRLAEEVRAVAQAQRRFDPARAAFLRNFPTRLVHTA